MLWRSAFAWLWMRALCLAARTSLKVLRSTAGSVALSYSVEDSNLPPPLLLLILLLLTTPAAAVVG
jgi:hypothetical protein